MSSRPPDYTALTFDCYGTLIDWRGGLLGRVRSAPSLSSRDFDVERFLTDREAAEASLESGAYRPYREIVALSVLEALGRQGIALTDREAEGIAATVGDWPPFAEVRGALERLRRGRRLAIVSNVERRDIERSVALIGVDFDLIVTAEDVRSYKPAKAHFRRALEQLGARREQVLHVAQSLFHDVRPVSDLGIDAAWINRLGGTLPGDLSVIHNVPDLSALADRLAAAG